MAVRFIHHIGFHKAHAFVEPFGDVVSPHIGGRHGAEMILLLHEGNQGDQCGFAQPLSLKGAVNRIIPQKV